MRTLRHPEVRITFDDDESVRESLLFKIEIDVGLTSTATPRIVSPLKVPASCIPA
jgi:hypothetical protein